MSKEVLVIVLGIIIALTPFLGLPGDWRTILLVIVGLSLAVIGFFLRSETLERGGIERSSFFVDNRHSAESTSAQGDTVRPPTRIQ